MFANHEYSGHDSIELYVMLQDPQLSQPIESQVVDPIEAELAEVDVVEEEEEDEELKFDNMVNDDSEDDVLLEIPPNEIYTPPSHMKNFNMGEYEPSSDIFNNPYMQSDENLKEKDKFSLKEKCVRAVKKLTASYRMRSDCWVIGFMSTHTCVNSTASEDHRKLSYDLVSQEIYPLISNDPSVKVKTIISDIAIVYNYTPSYRKAWLAKTKAIEKLYRNWEDSYKELSRYMHALRTYSPGTVYIMLTLPAYAPNESCVNEYGIFCRLFWPFQPCITGFASCKPIIQIYGTWLFGEYKDRLLMAVA
ncbi:uncharacterized protein LOC131609997 [Vicia villosa]|uniref:uncharacterized protein LOC131609997 n=1 Tax=Vicia villosa TaxID=3911 RepID=UPI00273BE309|nr:uncharacterized protein LOC131609997 [Vicia villosa]